MTKLPQDRAGHWHVDTGRDEGPEIYVHIFDALVGARWHVNEECDYWSQGASVLGDPESMTIDYEGAAKSAAKADVLSALVANIDNMTETFFAEKVRPPLYVNNFDALLASAEHTVASVLAESTFVQDLYYCDSPRCPLALCDECGDEIEHTDDVWEHVDDVDYGHDAVPSSKVPDLPALFRFHRDDSAEIVRGTAKTLTAGDLVAFLRKFDPSKPITIDAQDVDGLHGGWLNISGALLPNVDMDDEGPSILLIASDDFDTRQW